jgi:hypothetical protein
LRQLGIHYFDGDLLPGRVGVFLLGLGRGRLGAGTGGEGEEEAKAEEEAKIEARASQGRFAHPRGETQAVKKR